MGLGGWGVGWGQREREGGGRLEGGGERRGGEGESESERESTTVRPKRTAPLHWGTILFATVILLLFIAFI